MSIASQHTPGRATEQEAERAIAILRSAIEAAENSNQAGEDFVCAAIHGPALLDALRHATCLIRDAEKDTNWVSGDPYGDSAAVEFEKLIAKAAGASQ